MSTEQDRDVAEVERLIDIEAPDAMAAIVAFLDQPDDTLQMSPQAMDIARLGNALRQARAQRSKKRRIEKAREVWTRYLEQEHTAPQLQLAEVVTRLYQRSGGPARQILRTLIREAPLRWGLWGGLKRTYKQVEVDLDAELFGAFAARFDVELSRGPYNRDVSVGTLKYLSRRTWRFLRQLGKASPELYVTFAVEVLRNYPAETRGWSAWCGRHIRNHWSVKWGRDPEAAGKPFGNVPYRQAWARSPDPLMLLLETCEWNDAAGFAIEGLQALHPEALRQVTPEWLARLCFRSVARAHELVVDTLEGNPEYHTARLQQLGLHDAVMALLRSPSARARTYAIAYARGHAEAMSVEQLAELLDDDGYRDVTAFAAEVLATRPPRTVGLPMVVRLLQYDASRAWAQQALNTAFEPNELTDELLTRMLLVDDYYAWQFARKFVAERLPKGQLGPAFWIALLERRDDPNAPYDLADYVFERLGELPLSALPADWVLEMLADDDFGYRISSWLARAGTLPAGLDVERIKGLAFDPKTRSLAFTLLDNPKLVSPGDVGIDWLLALARRADPSLHQWAHKYLLQHVGPAEMGDGSVEAGVARMFSMAKARKESEAARHLAQTWLLCRHPRLGPQQRESQELSIPADLPHEAYTADLVWPTLWDDRGDVRRFGVAVARAELAHWGEPHRVYELADSPHREVRNIAYDALTQAGKPTADPAMALSLDDLDPALVFSMTESTVPATRDVAMALIREHYRRLGGAERLGWLMQSADREVRMFAVKLLWERHRPTRIPQGWVPQTVRGNGGGPGFALPSGGFDDGEALRGLLRRLLFAVPPARGGEKGERRGGRRVPANQAKRRIVEVVRDFGLQDPAFAALIAPVLAEFTGSVAKGEWQACLAALMSLRAAHGDLGVDLLTQSAGQPTVETH
ncbi:MAG: hypothetical protein R3F59_21090 [Myxococcota bacterium]